MWIIIKFFKIKSEILCPDEELQKWFDNHWLFVDNEDQGYVNRSRSGNPKAVCIFRGEIIETLEFDVQWNGNGND